MILKLDHNRPNCFVSTHLGLYNGRNFSEDIFKYVYLNENCCFFIVILLKFVPHFQVNNIPALFQIIAWCRSGDNHCLIQCRPSLLMHICVCRSEWNWYGEALEDAVLYVCSLLDFIVLKCSIPLDELITKFDMYITVAKILPNNWFCIGINQSCKLLEVLSVF